MVTEREDRSARGLFDYAELELSGEAAQAARRMEARALEPASDEMFAELIVPLLAVEPQRPFRVLEVGSGSGALARRLAGWAPEIVVDAVDKSATMVRVARGLAEHEGLAERLVFECWDAGAPERFPFGAQRYDLILSSVVVPYLAPREVEDAVALLAELLVPGGVLAFVEQDLQTDALHHPDPELRSRVLAKDERVIGAHFALGLRGVLVAAGLEPLARRSFLWTEEHYGEYLHDLLSRIADDAAALGRIDGEERVRWEEELRRLADAGEFYYGLVYHRVAARRPLTGWRETTAASR